MKQYATLDDSVYFWFAANDTSGSGGDGATPAADVRLAGAAADAAPVYSPTPVLLSHASYPAGAYEIAIAATAANGFAADNTYAVFCTLAIDAQNPTGFVGSFDLKPVEANATQIGDSAAAASAYTAARAGYLDELAAANMPADLDKVLADTNELQTDWKDGGRLDLLIDAILMDTGTTLNALIKRVLGLTQENYYIDNTIFETGKLKSARIRIYSIAGSVGTDADVIATYNITVTFDANGNMEIYKVTKA